MTRLLLTIFFVGLVVSAASFAAAVGLGGNWPPHIGKVSIGDSDNDNDKDRGERLPEPGPVASREIAWEGGDDLTVNVPADVTYIQGPVAKITVIGPNNWINLIEVDGGDISLKGRSHRLSWDSENGTALKITVHGPDVRNFEMNGAQSLVISAYDQDALDVTVDGAARIIATGKTRALSVEMNGAGRGDFGGLAASEAEITLNGAGSVTAAPTEKADLEINGVGSINLRTRPSEVHQAIHGIGSVTYDSEPSQPAAPAAPAPAKSPKGTAA